MRDFICRNCFKKSKAEHGDQIYCRRPTCIHLAAKDEKRKESPRKYSQTGTAGNYTTRMDPIA